MKKIYISAIFITFLIHFFVVNNSAADTTTPYCPSSRNAVIAPAFNQTMGYCVTRPIDSYNTCPDGYTYSMDYKTCVSLPLCLGTSIWDANKKQCQAFSPTSSSSSWISIPDNSCAVDSNGDGEVQQNEIFACTQTPQGYICPQGQTECTEQFSQPIDEGSITVSGQTSTMSYGTFQGKGNKLCHIETGTCLEFSFHSGQIVVTGQMSKPDYWTFVGSGNQMVATYLASPCDSHYSNGKFVFNFSQGNITIVPQTSPLSYIASGCHFHAVSNGNQLIFYDGASTGSITFTYNPGTTCPSGTLQSNGCFLGYNCPLGNYPCMQVNNQWMCSSNQCITQSQLEDEGDIIPSGLDDDGPRDSDGNCLGTVLIFNGKGMRCQKAGVKTGFHNCCDESQGKIYDRVGSTGISAITDAVKAIYAATEAIKIGSYAYKIATEVYKYSGGALVDATTSLPIANFAPQTPEWFALKAAADNVNQGADVAVGAAMGTYIEKMGPQIATAIAQLAISQAISDPVIASAVNLAFSASLWIAGSAGGPIGFALSAATLAANLFMANCDKQDIMTSTFNDSGFCHYVGSWCMKKWPLVGCVQRANGYCCFNSKLARIIQEQGRPQLNTFGVDGAWGSPKHPSCRGFTPDEFQSLDFNKIDLSEYVGDIQRNIRQNIQGNVQQIFNQSIQQLTR